MRFVFISLILLIGCKNNIIYDLTLATTVNQTDSSGISAYLAFNDYSFRFGMLGSDSGVTWLHRNRPLPDTVHVVWKQTFFNDKKCPGDKWAVGDCKIDTASYREYNVPVELKSHLPPLTETQKYHNKFLIHEKGKVSLRVAVHGINETWYTDGVSTAQ